MYERFTDRARKVMMLANQEAQRFNHEYVDTPHILLGLVKEGGGVAANVLKHRAVDLRKIRLEVEKLMQSGPDIVLMGKLPQTPDAKKAIEAAMEEARNLNHNYVGTEHLLLGLCRNPATIAVQVLTLLGAFTDSIRVDVLALLGHGASDGPDESPAADNPAESKAWAMFATLGSLEKGIHAWASGIDAMQNGEPTRKELKERLAISHAIIGEGIVKYEYELRKSTLAWKSQVDGLKKNLAAAQEEIEKLKATAGATS